MKINNNCQICQQIRMLLVVLGGGGLGIILAAQFDTDIYLTLAVAIFCAGLVMKITNRHRKRLRR